MKTGGRRGRGGRSNENRRTGGQEEEHERKGRDETEHEIRKKKKGFPPLLLSSCFHLNLISPTRT
jgi:hypothetical protein